MLRQYKLKDYNFRLVLLLIAISVLGVLLVGSADPSLQKKQMIGVIAGLIFMFIISLMDYSWILNFYWFIYGLMLALLLLVLVMGSTKIFLSLKAKVLVPAKWRCGAITTGTPFHFWR